MRVALAQLNPTVGDLRGNLGAIEVAMAQAAEAGADLLVTPELALCGYPPRDLLDRPVFIADNIRALGEIVAHSGDLHVLVGAVVAAEGDPLQPPSDGSQIANAAVLCTGGKVIACHRKLLLPSYDVFDERRYFRAGTVPTVVELGGVRVAITVCEDIWNHEDSRVVEYSCNPVAMSCAAGAQALINISASPYDRDKPLQRYQLLRQLCTTYGVELAYCNQVGGNDGLLFDGGSVVINGDGEVVAMAAAFQPDLMICEFAGAPRSTESGGDSKKKSIASILEKPHDDTASVCEALVMGVRDYARKCRFERAVIGLSGGIDSAVTAAIAERALGPSQVIGITMMSRYSSQGSRDDAALLGSRLGIRVDAIPIEPLFTAYLKSLSKPFSGHDPDVTEENLQARIRGTLLMAYSNKFGALLLTTGNKSELAVGYCTLYGDMCGGLGVISDLYKTEVYALARYLNEVDPRGPIPVSCIEKPPSAELRHDQRDEDSLPPYDRLDSILRAYIDNARSVQEIVAMGHPADQVTEILAMVDRNEYKRSQMPPGLRVSRKAFGVGRRLPIAQTYRQHL